MSRLLLRKTAALVAVFLTLGFAAAPAQISVVVNKNNPISDLPLAALQRLYLGRQTAFTNGLPVALCEYGPARHRFYQKVLHMDETAVSRHWIGLVFSERNALPPAEFRNTEAVGRFVMTTPGALCFIDLAGPSDEVKVITIGGFRPEEREYPVR